MKENTSLNFKVQYFTRKKKFFSKRSWNET